MAKNCNIFKNTVDEANGQQGETVLDEKRHLVIQTSCGVFTANLK